MNSMIVFLAVAVFAAPALAAWGPPNGGYAQPIVPANIALSADGHNILDTPEVAQARAAHFAAVSQAQTAAATQNGNDDGSYDKRWEQESEYQGAPQWNAAPAQNQWNAAPAQQWNAAPAQQWNAAPAQQWNAAPAQNQYNAEPATKRWNGPPANIALSADGQRVLDTPEVAQARAAHLAAYANLQSAAPAAPAQQWNAAPAQQWNAAPAQHQWNAAPAQQYSGAPAQQQWNAAPAQQYSAAPAQQWNAAPVHAQPAPVWQGAPSWQSAPAQNKWANAPSQIHLSQDGQNILDTAEVAQARAAHLAAHAAAAAAAPAPSHGNRY